MPIGFCPRNVSSDFGWLLKVSFLALSSPSHGFIQHLFYGHNGRIHCQGCSLKMHTVLPVSQITEASMVRMPPQLLGRAIDIAVPEATLPPLNTTGAPVAI